MDKKLSAQEQYLRSISHTKQLVRFWRVFLTVFFLLLWECSARFGLINSFIFSSPTKLARCLYGMLRSHALLSHIGVTLAETLVSFALVTAVSLLLSVLLWNFDTLSSILEPYMVMLNSLPKSALAPLFIVWLGANFKTIILTGMSVAVFGSIMSLYTSFLEVDAEKIKLIYTLGGTKRTALYKVVLPANVPAMFALMKVNIGLCLVGVIIGEFIAAKRGLGYLIIYGSQIFKMDWVLLAILILCVISMCLYILLNRLEQSIQNRMHRPFRQLLQIKQTQRDNH